MSRNNKGSAKRRERATRVVALDALSQREGTLAAARLSAMIDQIQAATNSACHSARWLERRCFGPLITPVNAKLDADRVRAAIEQLAWLERLLRACAKG